MKYANYSGGGGKLKKHFYEKTHAMGHPKADVPREMLDRLDISSSITDRYTNWKPQYHQEEEMQLLSGGYVPPPPPPPPPAPTKPTKKYTEIVYGDGKFVTNVDTTLSYIAYSNDGVDWTESRYSYAKHPTHISYNMVDELTYDPYTDYYAFVMIEENSNNVQWGNFNNGYFSGVAKLSTIQNWSAGLCPARYGWFIGGSDDQDIYWIWVYDNSLHVNTIDATGGYTQMLLYDMSDGIIKVFNTNPHRAWIMTSSALDSPPKNLSITLTFTCNQCRYSSARSYGGIRTGIRNVCIMYDQYRVMEAYSTKINDQYPQIGPQYWFELFDKETVILYHIWESRPRAHLFFSYIDTNHVLDGCLLRFNKSKNSGAHTTYHVPGSVSCAVWGNGKIICVFGENRAGIFEINNVSG